MKIQCSCLGNFEVVSQIPANGQFNIKCNSCGKYGFILNNQIYVEIRDRTYGYLVTHEDTNEN